VEEKTPCAAVHYSDGLQTGNDGPCSGTRNNSSVKYVYANRFDPPEPAGPHKKPISAGMRGELPFVSNMDSEGYAMCVWVCQWESRPSYSARRRTLERSSSARVGPDQDRALCSDSTRTCDATRGVRRKGRRCSQAEYE
jgi:hypothetical protein